MIIYKATSKTTGKIYIGQTKQTLKERINQHNSHAFNSQSNYHFHNAIRKYGPNDFQYEIIEDNINSAELLNEREKYWIEFYDSYNNGYNSTLGGDGRITRDDEAILKLFLEGKTTKEICGITKHSRNTVYKSYKIQNLSKQNNQRKNHSTSLRCSKKVEQYDLFGNFVKSFHSASECSKYGYQQSAVSSVCRQEQLSAYGYLWKYSEDNRSIAEWVERYNKKKNSGKPKKRIKQLDINKQELQIFNSAAEAARFLGKEDKSNICRAARKGAKAYGYYWEYIQNGDTE